MGDDAARSGRREGPEQVLNLLLDSLLTEDGVGNLVTKDVPVSTPEAMHSHLYGARGQPQFATQLTIAALRRLADQTCLQTVEFGGLSGIRPLAAEPRHDTFEYRARPASV